MTLRRYHGRMVLRALMIAAPNAIVAALRPDLYARGPGFLALFLPFVLLVAFTARDYDRAFARAR